MISYDSKNVRTVFEQMKLLYFTRIFVSLALAGLFGLYDNNWKTGLLLPFFAFLLAWMGRSVKESNDDAAGFLIGTGLAFAGLYGWWIGMREASLAVLMLASGMHLSCGRFLTKELSKKEAVLVASIAVVLATLSELRGIDAMTAFSVSGAAAFGWSAARKGRTFLVGMGAAAGLLGFSMFENGALLGVSVSGVLCWLPAFMYRKPSSDEFYSEMCLDKKADSDDKDLNKKG